MSVILLPAAVTASRLQDSLPISHNCRYCRSATSLNYADMTDLLRRHQSPVHAVVTYFTDRFSGPGRARGLVCVCACAQ